MIRAFVLFLILGAALSSFLYETSYKVQDLDSKRESLIRSIKAEQDSIKILQAEWSYLNEPKRLEELSKKFLMMQPMTNLQIKEITDIPSRTTVPRAQIGSNNKNNIDNPSISSQDDEIEKLLQEGGED